MRSNPIVAHVEGASKELVRSSFNGGSVRTERFQRKFRSPRGVAAVFAASAVPLGSERHHARGWHGDLGGKLPHPFLARVAGPERSRFGLRPYNPAPKMPFRLPRNHWSGVVSRWMGRSLSPR